MLLCSTGNVRAIRRYSTSTKSPKKRLLGWCAAMRGHVQPASGALDPAVQLQVEDAAGFAVTAAAMDGSE